MPTHPDGDLSTDELTTVATRIAKLLDKWDALAWPSVQYRLSEAGRVRSDPRVILRALAELANNRRPRRGAVPVQGPWQPSSAVFVRADMPSGEREQHSERIKQGLSWMANATALSVPPSCYLPETEHASTTTVYSEDASRRTVGHDLAVPVFQSVADVVSRSGRPASVWFTHDTEWLYPDDWRLWSFLAACARADTRPILLARKVAPITYPLLKQLGAFALQYYSYLVEDHLHGEALTYAAELGWFHTATVSSLRQHAVTVMLANALDNPADGGRWGDQGREAVHAAVKCGLDLEQRAGPEALLNWIAAAEISASPRWITTVERWHTFASYGRRAKSLRYRSEREHPQDRVATQLPEPSTDPVEPQAPTHGYGRKTEKIRVPLTIRW